MRTISSHKRSAKTLVRRGEGEVKREREREGKIKGKRERELTGMAQSCLHSVQGEGISSSMPRFLVSEFH
jgi:hypothetical protein